MQPTPNDEEPSASHDEGRLALRVRRHRFSYRDAPLQQGELALLAGISGRQVRSYERMRKLPSAIESLLAFAITLEVKIEDLVAPHLVAERVERIEARRAAFHGV